MAAPENGRYNQLSVSTTQSAESNAGHYAERSKWQRIKAKLIGNAIKARQWLAIWIKGFSCRKKNCWRSLPHSGKSYTHKFTRSTKKLLCVTLCLMIYKLNKCGNILLLQAQAIDLLQLEQFTILLKENWKIPSKFRGIRKINEC